MFPNLALGRKVVINQDSLCLCFHPWCLIHTDSISETDTIASTGQLSDRILKPEKSLALGLIVKGRAWPDTWTSGPKAHSASVSRMR